MMNWWNKLTTSRWRPVPQLDDYEGTNYSGGLLADYTHNHTMNPAAVEMRGFSSADSQQAQQVLQGDLRTMEPSKWRRVAFVVVATLALLWSALVIGGGSDSNGTGTQTDGSLSASSGATTISENVDDTNTGSFLPESTLEFILKHPNSAQGLALAWLEEQREIGDMENWRQQQFFALATLVIANCGDTGILEELDTGYECDWGSVLGFDLHCNDQGQVQTWKQPTSCEHSNIDKRMGSTSRLPPELALLSSLTNLYLPHNDIFGYIPTQLGLLTQLTYLGVGFNRLKGAIPSEFGRLTRLTSLLLNDNDLYSSLPTELGLLTALEALTAPENQITGPIPSQFQGMTSLRTIDLHQNQISGSIPETLSTLTSLRLLRMEENQLTGSLPSTLGELTALTGLILPHNQLSGSLPTTLGQLTHLQMGLLFGDNQLTGNVPTQLGMLTHLLELGLAANAFEGTLPTQLQALTQLTQFSIHDNPKVTGRIPSKVLAEWEHHLQILWLYNTTLTGSIPCDAHTLMASHSVKADCDNVDCTCCKNCPEDSTEDP